MKIALVGKMRAGKDQLASYLIDKHNFKKFAFADGITEIIEKYYPNESKKGKPRHHYQHIGQALRELDTEVWINYLYQRVAEYEKECGPSNIIITDVRQENEVESLKAHGYLVIKVSCDDEIRIKRIIESGDNFSPESFLHDTERQVDKAVPHIEIRNEGTLQELYLHAEGIIKYYHIWGKLNESEQLHGKERGEYFAKLLQAKRGQIL